MGTGAHALHAGAPGWLPAPQGFLRTAGPVRAAGTIQTHPPKDNFELTVESENAVGIRRH